MSSTQIVKTYLFFFFFICWNERPQNFPLNHFAFGAGYTVACKTGLIKVC